MAVPSLLLQDGADVPFACGKGRVSPLSPTHSARAARPRALTGRDSGGGGAGRLGMGFLGVTPLAP